MTMRRKRKATTLARLTLERLEARELLAGDIVMFNDVGRGAGTAANATSFVANDVASGLLKNVTNGEETGITLTTSHLGAAFGTGGGTPQGTTDLATVFNGYVDFGSTTTSLIEIAGSDSYTSHFSGLDPVNRFDLVASAVRGNSNYFNRWTLFTIEGAETFQPAHSSGRGIVTEGLADNQVAVWTGANHESSQGFVAQWLDIDPGADGEFELVSQQYRGATPGIGSGTANGIAGYAASGLRLTEHDFDPPTVLNVAATSVLATSAVIGGELVHAGGLDSELTVYWGTTDGGVDPGSWDASVPFGDVEVGEFSERVTGLSPETRYYFRAFASNEAGDAWADEASLFVTGALSAPSFQLNPVTEVGAHSATISGAVTDVGGDPPTITVFFGTTDGGTSPDDWSDRLEMGERVDSFSASLSELSATTEYFYRVQATNDGGTAWSPSTDSFTTGDTPLIAISEFMAQNISTLTTRTRVSSGTPFAGEPDTPDWIEIHNLSGSPLNIGGMHLTDNSGDPNKWQFPTGTMVPSNGQLVVFASGKDITDVTLDERGYLHTNFSLSSSGEYLALTDSVGQVIDAYTDVPSQIADISYGRVDGAHRYFATATPGAPNSTSYLGLVADTNFSVKRGFFEAPFDVAITSDTEGATIRYTLDGSAPSENDGTVYTGPVTISETTTLRAIAFKPGLEPTNVDTQTYIFLDDVIQQTPQSTIDAGFPTSWNGTSPDYGMDPDVIGPNDDFDGRYAATIKDDLTALPTLSIVGDIDDLFGPNGVYTNPDSSTIEKPISFEMITADDSEEFQINAGIKIQGGAFRSWGLTKKKSLRVKFKSAYGPTKLKYPVFGPDAAQEFDTLTLRMEANDGWQWNGAGGQPQFARDQFGRNVQLAMGQPASHGRFTHVYLNGVYWGMYNMVERPDQSFGESYVGGDKDDWDGLNSGTPINADDAARRNRANDAWDELVSLSRDVSSAATEADRTAAFMKVQGLNPDGSNNPNWESYLNAENMIDYFLVNWYGGNSDWPRKNYYVGRENGTDSEGFHFFMWDSEWSLFLRSSLSTNNIDDSAGVAQPIQLLRDSEEFRLMFADRVHKHLVTPGGPLYVDPENPDWDPEHPERNVPASIYAEVTSSNFDGIVGESARWGDQHRSEPYTRDDEYQAEHDRIMEDWFPNRSAVFLEQLVDGDLYPAVHAPVLYVDGQSQYGGEVNEGAKLSMTAAAATVTTDTTLVALDASVTAHVVTDGSLESGNGPHWNDVDFDDSQWTAGTNGVGFGSDYNDLIGTNVQAEWISNSGKSLYTRFEFDLPADFTDDDVDRLQLNAKYDDGYAVYLNGQQIHAKNTPDDPVWDSAATAKRLNLINKLPNVYEKTDVSEHRGALRAGKNVLAVHVLNHPQDAGDILTVAELIMSNDTSVRAPIVYTLDGTDPREQGGNSVGTLYGDEITLTETTTVKARALVNDQWSALNEVTFIVNPAKPGDIVISEINYNPAAPTPEELASIGTLDNDDFEFLEILNRGESTVNLLGAHFTNGLDFEFPEYEIEPGERVVVARDLAAFELRYGTDATVLGSFTDGGLSNGGEELAIADLAGNTLVEFEYDDGSLWPQNADGVGGTLELANPEATPSNQLGKWYRWRGSVDWAGSPGTTGAVRPAIRISEVLANTDMLADEQDTIELHNPSAAPIDISGWYLSDSGSSLTKFRIPEGTVVAARGYVVFDESDFNPTPDDPGPSDFALSGSNGDPLWLTIHANNTVQFIDDIEFGASESGVSFIREQGSLLPSAQTTIGCHNGELLREYTNVRMATVVVSEINYNPGEPSAAALAVYSDLVEDDLEFIEIHNPLLDAIELTDWRLRGGADIEFAAGTTLASGETAVVISFDPDKNDDRTSAFRTHYGISDSVRLIGGFSGQLSDSSEAVRLLRPGSPDVDDPTTIPRILVDEVIYDDQSPWPNADGTGETLQRTRATATGSANLSWASGNPTPGSVAAVTTPHDLDGDGFVGLLDLAILSDAIRNGNTQRLLDVDGNGIVDDADPQSFLQDVLKIGPGDANGDGVVDGSDFNQWNDYSFTTCLATWAHGDFNFDGTVDASDFNIWSNHRFTGLPAQAHHVANRPPVAPADFAFASENLGSDEPRTGPWDGPNSNGPNSNGRELDKDERNPKGVDRELLSETKSSDWSNAAKLTRSSIRLRQGLKRRQSGTTPQPTYQSDQPEQYRITDSVLQSW